MNELLASEETQCKRCSRPDSLLENVHSDFGCSRPGGSSWKNYVHTVFGDLVYLPETGNSLAKEMRGTVGGRPESTGYLSLGTPFLSQFMLFSSLVSNSDNAPGSHRLHFCSVPACPEPVPPLSWLSPIPFSSGQVEEESPL